MVATSLRLIAGLMMVSRVRYYSFKGLPFGGRVPFVTLLLALGLLVLLYIDPARVLLGAFSLYLLSGPAAWAWARLRRGRATPSTPG